MVVMASRNLVITAVVIASYKLDNTTVVIA